MSREGRTPDACSGGALPSTAERTFPASHPSPEHCPTADHCVVYIIYLSLSNLSIYLPIYLLYLPSIFLSFLSILSIYISIYLSFFLSFFLSICLSTYLPIYSFPWTLLPSNRAIRKVIAAKNPEAIEIHQEGEKGEKQKKEIH